MAFTQYDNLDKMLILRTQSREIEAEASAAEKTAGEVSSFLGIACSNNTTSAKNAVSSLKSLNQLSVRTEITIARAALSLLLARGAWATSDKYLLMDVMLQVLSFYEEEFLRVASRFKGAFSYAFMTEGVGDASLFKTITKPGMFGEKPTFHGEEPYNLEFFKLQSGQRFCYGESEGNDLTQHAYSVYKKYGPQGLCYFAVGENGDVPPAFQLLYEHMILTGDIIELLGGNLQVGPFEHVAVGPEDRVGSSLEYTRIQTAFVQKCAEAYHGRTITHRHEMLVMLTDNADAYPKLVEEHVAEAEEVKEIPVEAGSNPASNGNEDVVSRVSGLEKEEDVGGSAVAAAKIDSSRSTESPGECVGHSSEHSSRGESMSTKTSHAIEPESETGAEVKTEADAKLATDINPVEADDQPMHGVPITHGLGATEPQAESAAIRRPPADGVPIKFGSFDAVFISKDDSLKDSMYHLRNELDRHCRDAKEFYGHNEMTFAHMRPVLDDVDAVLKRIKNILEDLSKAVMIDNKKIDEMRSLLDRFRPSEMEKLFERMSRLDSKVAMLPNRDDIQALQASMDSFKVSLAEKQNEENQMIQALSERLDEADRNRGLNIRLTGLSAAEAVTAGIAFMREGFNGVLTLVLRVPRRLMSQ